MVAMNAVTFAQARQAAEAVLPQGRQSLPYGFVGQPGYLILSVNPLLPPEITEMDAPEVMVSYDGTTRVGSRVSFLDDLDAMERVGDWPPEDDE